MHILGYHDTLALWNRYKGVTVMAKDSENVLAYSWIRFSTAPQEQGDSVRRQTDLRDAWLARNPGVSLDKSLTMKPAGVSGLKGEQRTNPKFALAEFLDLVARHRIKPGSFLIVENLDRLTREHPAQSIPFVLSLVSSGIRVVQLVPNEVVYDSHIDEFKLMMLLMDLSRGHGESKRKSGLLSEMWAAKKRAAREGVPHGRTIPAWLELRDGSYRLDPDKARIVRNIVLWSIEGFGATSIIKRLTQEGVPSITGRKRWNRSYIDSILNGRAVVGEYQPCKGSGSLVPDGEPIPGYFPPVVSEEEWQAAKAARQRRLHRSGRPSRNGLTTSPFAGLLYSAIDGEKMRVAYSRGVPFFASAGRVEGNKQPARGMFPLSHLVDGVLSQLRELPAAELFNDDGAHQVQEIEAKLTAVENRLTIARERFRNDAESSVWAEEVTISDRERRVLLDERNAARQAAANPVSATWTEAVELMKRDEPARLRQCLLATVSEMWMVFGNREKGERIAVVQVWFNGGGRRDYLVYSFNPTGWHVRKRKAKWVCRSLADMMPGTVDLRDKKQAARVAKLLTSLDISSL